jgi:hypothetical protein
MYIFFLNSWLNEKTWVNQIRFFEGCAAKHFYRYFFVYWKTSLNFLHASFDVKLLMLEMSMSEANEFNEFTMSVPNVSSQCQFPMSVLDDDSQKICWLTGITLKSFVYFQHRSKYWSNFNSGFRRFTQSIKNTKGSKFSYFLMKFWKFNFLINWY